MHITPNTPSVLKAMFIDFLTIFPFFFRFLTTDRVSWCLTTIGEIIKRLLVAFTRIVNRGRHVGHILDVQVRPGDARAAADAEVSIHKII